MRCFPQEYYTNLITSGNINDKYNSALNKDQFTVVEHGIWLWIMCSVSNYKAKFDIIVNNEHTTERDLITETYYQVGINEPKLSIYPFRYFMSDNADSM